MKKILSSLSLFLLLNIASLDNSDAAVGAKVGLYFPDGMTVSSQRARDFDTDSGLTFGLFSELRAGDNLLISPFVDYTSFQNGAKDAITLVDVGGDLKLKLAVPGLRLGAGIAAGIGNLETDPAIGFVSESANFFLVYRAFVEKDFNNIIGEAGIRGYTGGNEEDVDIYPGLYLRVGFRFKTH